LDVFVSEDRVKNTFNIGREVVFQKEGYIRIILQKTRINLNSRDII